MRSLAVVVIALSSVVPASTAPNETGSSPAVIVTLPGDANRFSNYDYRQSGFGAVDWPVTFVFTGNASIQRIKDALCQKTASAWTYCDRGGSMHLFAQASSPDGAFDGFLGDGGVKRFKEACSTTDFTAHMRLYAPPANTEAAGDSFASGTYGSIVIATAHLDFEDRAGCAGRIHGYSDVAEKWFIDAMRSIDGWQVRPDTFDLGNANDTYVVMRELSGTEVPHVYGNDRFATQVIVP